MSGCPVCNASFRGSVTCPRCGADLTGVMSLAVRAWRSRENAREALAADDWIAVADLVDEAQRLQDTPAGRALAAVARVLNTLPAN